MFLNLQYYYIFNNQSNFNKHFDINLFINFFYNNNVDLPKIFKKTNSLYRAQNNNFFLKFINLIMERGLFDKTNNCFIKALTLVELNIFNSSFSPYFYFYFSKFFIQNSFFTNNFYLNQDKGNLFLNSEKQFNYKYLLLNILLTSFKPLYFMFNIYFNKIDKKIKKFSRGKSSKYRIIYKYVAPYKRLNLLGFWLNKDIKFFPAHKLINKISSTLLSIIFSSKKTLIWKIKKIIYLRVYRNYKSTLLLTSKSTR